MVALVTLERAKSQVIVDFDDDDLLLQDICDLATDAVINYIGQPDHTWTDATVPGTIKAAILLMVSDMYSNRGDDMKEHGQADGYLPKPVTSLLHRYRSPVLA